MAGDHRNFIRPSSESVSQPATTQPMDADSLRCKPYRLALLAGIVLIIPLGYFVRFSKALHAPLLQDIGGSLAYQILMMLGVAFLFPRLSLVKCAVGVFAFSCAVEFLQLWKAPFIREVRATWPGRVILGDTFVWADFPPYAAGCLLGWIVLRSLQARFTSKESGTSID